MSLVGKFAHLNDPVLGFSICEVMDEPSPGFYLVKFVIDSVKSSELYSIEEMLTTHGDETGGKIWHFFDTMPELEAWMSPSSKVIHLVKS